MALFNSGADLKPFKTIRRVRVSIVRLWNQYSGAGGLTIKMVLIDSKVSLKYIYILILKGFITITDILI